MGLSHARFYVACIVLLAAIAGLSGLANGQQDQTSTPTATPTPTPAGVDGNGTMVGSVGPVVDVLDYSYEDGTMTLLLEADTITSVTISQSADTRRSSGASSFNIKRVSLSPGRTRVSIRADTVAVTTPQSVEAGRGLRISAGAGPVFSSFDGADVVGAGVGGFGAGAGIIALIAYRKSGSTSQEVERVK